ncbi:MAG TPA: (Fe-S)-binding protein [Desulfatiglandales bacterium]|nr:(Fe-S)-binding protein [Desulfatiglandales bacterium]
MDAKYDFERKYRDQILRCSSCGFCQAVCPIFTLTLRPALNTRGKMLLLKEIMDGSIEFSHGVAETFYACTTCQACAVTCPAGVEGHEIVEEVRKQLYKDGLAPESLLGVRESLSKSGNVYASAREDRVDIYPAGLRKKAQSGKLPEKADTLLFMGCLPSYLDMKIVPSTIKALDAGKVDYTTLGVEETCCGFPLYLMGSDEFKPHAEKLIEKIKATGARELVTPCAGCYKTFTKLYPEIGDLGLEIYHTVQYFDKLVAEGKIGFSKEVAKKVTYHDPCDLGRACKIFEEPRAILKRIPGLEYVEMAKNRLDARCCGGGGGMQACNPELAVDMASLRIRDALAVGAEIIVSGCPACKDNLRKGARAIPKEERGKIKIVDLTEMVTDAMN